MGQRAGLKHLPDLQRQFAEGRLVLPDVRPAVVDERARAVLTRHVRDRVPYGVLARELHLEPNGVRRLAVRAAAALRHPDLADLPSGTRRSLMLGGYTSRAAIARASDAAAGDTRSDPASGVVAARMARHAAPAGRCGARGRRVIFS